MTNNISVRNEVDWFPDYGTQIDESMSFADLFVNRNYLMDLSNYEVVEMREDLKNYGRIRLYRITKVVFNEDEDINDKLISVYSALQALGSTAILVIKSSEKGVEFYLGVYSVENVSAAGKILEHTIDGNFPGSTLDSRNAREIKSIMQGIDPSDSFEFKGNVASVSVIPATRDDEKQNFVQGIEKFIDTMKGREYTAVIVATPLSKTELNQRKRGLEEVYSTISPYAGVSLSYGRNDSKAVAEGTFRSFSSTISKGVTDSTTLTSGETDTESKTDSRGHGFGFGFFNTNRGRSTGTSKGYSSSSSWAKSVSETESEGEVKGTNVGETVTAGDSRNLTLTHENKSVKNLMEQIEGHLERIKESEAYGMWECAGYFISGDIQVAVVAANTYKALMSGQKSCLENSFVNIWHHTEDKTRKVLEYIQYGVHPKFRVELGSGYAEHQVTPASLISGSELPIFLGLPRHSVTGVTSLSMAEFGRNVISANEKKPGARSISLGNVYHMGKTETNEVALDIDSLTSHCFITGSTGSGKSNTSYGILLQLVKKGVKFLVIEPAKGEYKKDLGGLENINIFTTNPRYYRMLRLNPFSFHENIHVLEHIDRLIEIFSVCWPLYAAMPAILKDAIERVYEKCGWDLNSSIWFGNEKKFPTFVDLLEVLPEIINKSSYSSDTKGDYIGSLVTRVKSLTVGITGQVLSNSTDIPDSVLFDENTIVDISRVGSSETKSLLMGILVLKLNEYRMSTATEENAPLKHVTVLEEAHNLLKRVSLDQSQESSNIAGKSVEMICNSIAEMRTYGEGFIIIDQSPTSVDISAIKNTNTKIIMRLPESRDCETVGGALSLNEKQIAEISKLPGGKAIVWQNDWYEAVLTAIYYCPKVKGEVQIVDQGKLAKVNGKLITELFRQKDSAECNTDRFVGIINESELPPLKKEELIEFWQGEIATAANGSKFKFAELLTEAVNCKGLIRAIPCSFEGFKVTDIKSASAKIKAEVRQWYQTFCSVLETFVVFDDEKTKEHAIRYIMFFFCKVFKEDDRFRLIYYVIFN